MSTLRTLLMGLVASCVALAAEPVKDAVPLFFIANQGQAPPAVRFMAKGSGLTAYFSPHEALFRGAGSSVRIEFEGANPTPRVEGIERLPGHANFLIGAQRDWRREVPLYGAVVYRELYPGIDMVYAGEGRDLKSEFVVAPGADPSRIRLRYAGGEGVRVKEDGALAIPVDGRELREQAPTIYQERSGRRVAVEGRFAVDDDGAVRFQIGDYDIGSPLIIDPVLSYSTLLGGSGFDTATALAVDSAGSAYVAGFTESYNFPTANPEQNFNAGGNDAFVAKLNASGNGLVYCTYVGGSADDRAYGIAVDANGSAYVTGSTISGNFPVRNALQSKLAGGRNAFVLKLNPAGNTLVYSTYLGGNASDNGNGIAVDAGGNAYVVGDTTSINFPATGFQRGNHGGQDAFVAKLSADGSRLLYSTYLGGENDDRGAGIVVDASGSAYITGSTYSTDFPVASAFQSRNGGGQDAFIARLSADGNSLVFSTYLGGAGGIAAYPEAAQGIALDSQGSAYVAGVTSSANFPLLGAVQTSLRGSTDAFVAKLTASGTLVYSTYLGGSGVDVGNAIAVDASGSAYIVGYSYSTDLPVTATALQTSNAGDCDAFLAKLSAAGNSLAYLSYLGGNSSDTATAVALDTYGNVYVAGWTLSTNFPLLNPYQSTNAGNYGAFIAKMVFSVTPANVGVTPNSGSGVSQTFSFQFSDDDGAADLASVSVLFNSALSTVNACAVTYNRAQYALSLLTDAGIAAGTITPGSGSQQNSQCTLNGAGSSVSASGTVLTLNLSITFQAAFNGLKNIYMQAVSPFGSTGWQQSGSWSVFLPLAVVSATPASGSGASQTFGYLIFDQKGASDVAMVWMQISTGASASSCYSRYDAVGNNLYLLNDANTAWYGPATPGSGATLENSQCVLSASGSSVVKAGTSMTVSVALAFKPAFVGAKTLLVYVNSATANTGWQSMGTWTVTAPASPLTIVSVSPNGGTGSAQTFSYVISDSYGASDLAMVWMQISTGASASSCYSRYDAVGNNLYLLNDANTAWYGPATPGSGVSLENSQCVLSASGSSVAKSGTSMTLSAALSFKPAFAGAKAQWVYANSATMNTGWQNMGSWTVTAPPAPLTIVSVSPLTIVSVSPNSGTGSAQTFSYVISDSYGASDLAMVWMQISTGASAGSCYSRYDAVGNNLYLLNDANTAWYGPATPGSGVSLQNSQCTLSASGSSVVNAGTSMTVSVALSFKPAFAGAKTQWVYANSATINTGWQDMGSWAAD
jgi:hypothetical protein